MAQPSGTLQLSKQGRRQTPAEETEMAKITIDRANEIFGSKTTIADLAQFTEILSRDSDRLNIYEVEEAMTREWKHEIASWEYEYLTGYTATFKDGSRISIGAWADELPVDQTDEDAN
jgi:hypothetical protein